MSLGDWTSTLSVVSSQESVATKTSSAFTLNDWLHKRKDDFKPENQINNFIKKAEQSLDEDRYEDAIALYTNAIELAPTESFLYTNRSFCHQMLEKFDSSLIDAQKAIELSDESVAKRLKTSDEEKKDYYKYRNKLMYYLKARALRESNRFQESIDTLVLSKTLAIECQFIDDEIKDIKLQAICDLGYDRPDVEEVCNQLDSIEELIKLLKLSKELMLNNETTDQLPSNPFKYRGLYVNGLASDLEEKTLEGLLSPLGELLRCKVYSNADQSRAIIAFLEEQSVREAIRAIRSHKEMIRDQTIDNLVFRYRHTCVEGITDLRTDPQIHFKGTEIGGECFKWRTTGCDDKDCKALHIPLCHHLDQQSVETKSIDRKRQPIVFDSSSKTDLTPNLNKTFKSSDKQKISFHTNGTQSEESPKSLTSPSKRLEMKTPIVFDIEDETQTKEINKSIASSDKKVVRLKTSSENETNGLTSTPNSDKSQRSGRKRIVFDLKDDDKPLGSPIDKCFKDLDSTPVPPPPITPNGRNIASYDDLFD